MDTANDNLTHVLDHTKIDGSASPLHDKIFNMLEGNTDMTTNASSLSKLADTIAETAKAMAGGVDPTHGAHFWEADTYLNPTSKNYDPKNPYVRKGWGSTPGTETKYIMYPTTATIGATHFMNADPKHNQNGKIYP